MQPWRVAGSDILKKLLEVEGSGLHVLVSTDSCLGNRCCR